jgi:methyltransferase
MIMDTFGWPQAVALAVLLQRGFEELYSQRNTRALIGRGAREVGATYYPVVATTHLAWIASLYFLISPEADINHLLAAMYLAIQVVRYWVIGTLGEYWTHRIFTLDGAPVIRRGPYQFISHPNYAVTIIETFLLPMVFGSIALGFIIGSVWAAVLHYKIILEDTALARRRARDVPLIAHK